MAHECRHITLENNPSVVSIDSESLREAHHRIANSLAILSGLVRMKAMRISKQADPLPAKEVEHLLERICARLAAVAEVHRKLAASPDRNGVVELDEHLFEIAGSLIAALSETAQLHRLEGCTRGCHVRSDHIEAVTLIVCEIVLNALKHAHPAGVPLNLWVGCAAADDGTLCVEVIDDGVGFPEDFDPEKSSGLGFRVVRSLAEQLGATLSFKSTSLGTHFLLALPDAVAAAAKVA
jgi:two-component sensor histidine kinase